MNDSISRTVLISLLIIVLITIISIIITNYLPDRGEELEELKNGWEFRWGDAENYSEMVTGEWIPMKTFPGQPPGRENRRFLLLRVKLPEITMQDPVLYIRSIHSLFELHVDGEKIFSVGNPGNFQKMPMDKLGSYFIPMRAEYSDSFAYFRIYSKLHFIGLQSSVFLTNYSSVLLYLLRTEIDELLLAAVFIFAGFLSLFISMRVHGTRAFLYFSAFVFLLGLYIARYTVLKQFVFNHPIFWLYVWMITIYLMPVTLLGLYKHIFGPGARGVVNILFKINLGYAVFYTMGLIADLFVRQLFIGYDLINFILTLRFILHILILTDIIVLIILSIIFLGNKNTDARIFLIGLAVLVGFAMRNILAVFGVGMLNFRSIIHWGMFGFMASLVIILVNHFKDTQDSLIRVKEELNLSRRIQQWILEDPIILLNKERKIIMTNFKTEELMSKKREDLTEKHYSEVIDEYSSLSGEIENLIEGNTSSFSCRFHFKNKERTLIDAKITRIEDEKAGEDGILIRGVELKETENIKDQFHITKRETEIIEYILLGFTNKRIASELNIAERTVKSHITSIYSKLLVSNKVQLMNKLKEQQMIPGHTSDRIVLLRTN